MTGSGQNIGNAVPLFITVDGKVGVIDLTTKYQQLSEKGAPNGYAELDGDGKIPEGQITIKAFSQVFEVGGEAAQLALSVKEGDICNRTDESKSYVAKNDVNASIAADWLLLLGAGGGGAVDSVDGRVGVVTLTDLYEAVFSKNTAFNKNFGSVAGEVAEGSALAAKADDSAVVHNTGSETIAGEKIFSDKIAVGPEAVLTPAKLIEIRKHELSGAVIDQQNLDALITSAEELFPWQSFQPSKDGSINQISVRVNTLGMAGVIIEIFAGEGTGGSLLFSSAGHFFVDGENSRVVSPPLAVLKDTLYTLQIRRAGVTVSWDRSGTDVYTRGRSNSDPNHDRWFKIFLQEESLTSLVADTETNKWGINKEEPEETFDVGGNVKCDKLIINNADTVLPDGTSASTQSPGDDSDKLATTKYADAVSGGPSLFVVLPPAAIVNWDLSADKNVSLTLDQNTTINLNNIGDGAEYTIELIQGGTGSYIVTWNSANWPAGVPPILTLAVGAKDFIDFKSRNGEVHGSFWGTDSK